MATEEKVEKKEKFMTHRLVDWVVLGVALLVILGSAGFYLYSVYDQTSLEMSDTYRQDVVVPVKTGSTGADLAPTTDNDLKEIDNSLNVSDPEVFSESNLNDKSIGL